VVPSVVIPSAKYITYLADEIIHTHTHTHTHKHGDLIIPDISLLRN
jgi:hypothetical protein